jgi:hypothetical protein
MFMLPGYPVLIYTSTSKIKREERVKARKKGRVRPCLSAAISRVLGCYAEHNKKNY